jgi:ABC-2 type transport system ATP-binding protein
MIECSLLTKNFRLYQKEPGILGSLKSFFHREWTTVAAVKDFSLLVQPGELVGLLGPNGAGKTTLMKLLTGLIVPSTGTIRVLGFEPAARAIDFRKQVALVMGQKSQLWWDIPALDSFELLKSYYEIPSALFKARLDELATLLGVTAVLKTHVRKLSLGERMKLELMAALLHGPRVLFLDEPTIGLDVVAQRAIREFILKYHRTYKTTILLTSHYMADVEALCDRIVLIMGGSKRFDGSLRSFETALGHDTFLSISFSRPVPESESQFASYKPSWSEDRQHVELQVPEGELTSIASDIFARLPVTNFSTEKLPIERVMHAILSNPELLAEGTHGLA